MVAVPCFYPMKKNQKIPSLTKPSITLSALSMHKSIPRGDKLWEFNPDDFSQFKDKIEGKKFVLALSGGKLKFACHLPLLRLIEILGIKVDELWGTSAGAVMCGLWANGMSAREIDRVLDDVNLRLLFDLFNAQAIKPALSAIRHDQKLRTAGIFPGIKIKNFIRDLLEKNKKKNPLLDLEDFHSVAYNVTNFCRSAFNITSSGKIRQTNFTRDQISGRKITDGDLADIMRASMAMVGIFWPEEIGGEYFLDGGITEQLPILSPFLIWIDDRKRGRETRDLFLLGISESFELQGDEIARDHEYLIGNLAYKLGVDIDMTVIRPEVPYTVLTSVPDFAKQIQTSKSAIIRELANK